jgi:hypothetical protein
MIFKENLVVTIVAVVLVVVSFLELRLAADRAACLGRPAAAWCGTSGCRSEPVNMTVPAVL